ncbi:MAG: hypothetical protein M0T83_03745, partial [Nitrospiraceae bacterium]|nr:hypothetical protein [Nitrospiraceae bacterium]
MELPEKKKRRRRRKPGGGTPAGEIKSPAGSPEALSSWAEKIVAELASSPETLVSLDLLLRRLIPKKNRNLRKIAEEELEVLVRAGSVLRLPDGRLAD